MDFISLIFLEGFFHGRHLVMLNESCAVRQTLEEVQLP